MDTTIAAEQAKRDRRIAPSRPPAPRLVARPSIERRTGERRRLDAPLSATWTTTREDEKSSQCADEPVEVTEISDTAAGLAAATVPLFRVGVHTSLTVGQHDAVVSICRVTTLDDDRSFYAVRFVNPTATLIQFIETLA